MNYRCNDCRNRNNPTGASVSPCYECKWMDDRPDHYDPNPKPRKRCETCKHFTIDPLDGDPVCMSKLDKRCEAGYRAAWEKKPSDSTREGGGKRRMKDLGDYRFNSD